jgi:hypothetical protein
VPEGMAEALLPLLDDGPERERVLHGLAGVRQALQADTEAGTAADRVADLAAELLEPGR